MRELIDQNKTVRARYDYDPYGGRSANLIVSNPVEADIGFTGHLWHQPSNLYLTRNRAYDADLGRWLTRDPIEEKGGLNLYDYATNNPLAWIDPFGLEIAVQRYWGVSGSLAFFGLGFHGEANLGVDFNLGDPFNSRIFFNDELTTLSGFGLVATVGTQNGWGVGYPSQRGTSSSLDLHAEAEVVDEAGFGVSLDVPFDKNGLGGTSVSIGEKTLLGGGFFIGGGVGQINTHASPSLEETFKLGPWYTWGGH